MRIEEDKQFLIKQREKGRPGCKEKEKSRKEKEDQRKRTYDEMSVQSGKIKFELAIFAFPY